MVAANSTANKIPLATIFQDAKSWFDTEIEKKEGQRSRGGAGLIIAPSGSVTLYDQLFEDLSDPANQCAILNAEESTLSKALIERLDVARRDFAEKNNRQVPTWGIFPAPWRRLSTRSTTQTVDSA